jgi:uracil-DNA glycosylase
MAVTFPARPAAAPAPIGATGGHVLIGCYHPSRQNTNTGTVTPAMYDDVFQHLISSATSRSR